MKIAYKLRLILILFAIIIQGCSKEYEIGKDNKNLKTDAICSKEKTIVDHIKNIGIDAFMVSIGDRNIIQYKSEDFNSILPYSEYNANPFGSVYKTGFFTMSVTKSWTAILIGTLIDKGFIEDTDLLISDYIPDWKESSGVTLHHLLTMTSGIPNMSPKEGLIFTKDKNSFARSLKPVYEPGSKWSYSNEAVQILSIFVENVTGQSLSQYAKENLFDPLQMNHSTMWMDKNGQTKAYADTITSIEDFHKVGLLILNNGKWNGKQIISEEWLTKMFTNHWQDGVKAYGFSGYGYLSWLDNIQGFHIYILSGQQNSKCIIIPQKNIVISTLQKTIPDSGLDRVLIPDLVMAIFDLVNEQQQR